MSTVLAAEHDVAHRRNTCPPDPLRVSIGRWDSAVWPAQAHRTALRMEYARRLSDVHPTHNSRRRPRAVHRVSRGRRPDPSPAYAYLMDRAHPFVQHASLL